MCAIEMVAMERGNGRRATCSFKLIVFFSHNKLASACLPKPALERVVLLGCPPEYADAAGIEQPETLVALLQHLVGEMQMHG